MLYSHELNICGEVEIAVAHHLMMQDQSQEIEYNLCSSTSILTNAIDGYQIITLRTELKSRSIKCTRCSNGKR